MKICPVCNESFEDNLKFCDLDGSRLTRSEVSSLRDPNKLWSMLGVGLLLGALLISAITVFYLPRASVSTLETTVGSETLPAQGTPKDTPATTDETPQGTVIEPQVIAEAVSSDAAKQKTAASVPETADSEADAAKSASQPGEEDGETSGAAPQPEAPPAASADPKTTTPAIKPVSDVKPSESASKPAQPTAESKKTTKPDSSKTKSQEKESDKKKKSEDEKKKKGGFLGVFKKIFGKDKKN